MIRVFDTIVAVVGLILAAPLLVLAAVGIKISSRGPVIYRAARSGAGGEPFTMFKLRTMHLSAADAGRITGARDPRVFRWGALLRAAKLDEVPQLINVLRGDMALVGPRPEDVTIVETYYNTMMWESLQVRPGITGPGALDYFEAESTLPDDPVEAERVYVAALLPRKIALDLVYVRNRSFRYHVELVARTLLSVVGNKAAFAQRQAWERATATSYLRETPG